MNSAPTNSESQPVQIRVQPTPNPQAWKFILDRPVLLDGKATYNTIEDCKGVRLAEDLLSVEGVTQVHFFGHVITISHSTEANVNELADSVSSVIMTRMPIHNPDYGEKDIEAARRAEMSDEQRQIEEILDRTIRPGLQGDGGDIDVVQIEGKKIYVSYQGACGTCPSATAGTLMAIESILQDEFDPEVSVIPV